VGGAEEQCFSSSLEKSTVLLIGAIRVREQPYGAKTESERAAASELPFPPGKVGSAAIRLRAAKNFCSTGIK